MLLKISLLILLLCQPEFVHRDCTVINVKDVGAQGDGLTLDTPAIQRAIDLASEKQLPVLFPPGKYLSGSLRLKTNTYIRLELGATILGSQRKDDYDPYEELGFPNDADVETSYFHHSLLWGEDIENIIIEGRGTIDSNFTKRGGPKALAFKRCKNIQIENITIKNTPNYAISLLGCEQVTINNVQILNAFSDGIDPDSCRFVFISNCRIESVDDAIVPKTSFSLGYRRPCTDITITNCYLSTRCNGFKLGTESGSDFKRITVSNCVITGLEKDNLRPGISGIAIESVDGSNIEGISVSNIVIHRMRTPIFIRLGNRGRDNAPGPGSIRHITLSNIVATNVSNPNIIAGIPNYPVEEVFISNLSCQFNGSNPLRPVEESVPEEESRYPEALMFESLPSYAFFIRHAKGVHLTNFAFSAQLPFWRLTSLKYRDITWDEQGNPKDNYELSIPGIGVYIEDTQELYVQSWRENTQTDETPILYLKDVQHARIESPIHRRNANPWCVIKGKESQDIWIYGQNNLNSSTVLEKDVNRNSIHLQHNTKGN